MYRFLTAFLILFVVTPATASSCEDLLAAEDTLIISRADHHKLYGLEGKKVQIRLAYKASRAEILGPGSSIFENFLPGEYLEDEIRLLKQEIAGPYWLTESSIYLSRKIYEGRIRNQHPGIVLYEDDTAAYFDLTRLLNREVVDFLIIRLR